MVGTIFFSVLITCGATHAGRIFPIPSENVKTAVRGLSRAGVRQIASMNDSYGLTIVNSLWPRYSSISQLAGVFVTNSQLTQADDVFVYTSYRSRFMY